MMNNIMLMNKKEKIRFYIMLLIMALVLPFDILTENTGLYNAKH